MNLVEKLNSTLRCVLSGQLSGEIDDTLLQKLLTKLQSADSTPDLVLGTDFLSYILLALRGEDRASSSLSFALQLLSVLIKKNVCDIFDDRHKDILQHLLQVFLVPPGDKSVSSSVRVSGLLCLTALMDNDAGCDWILQNNLVEVGWSNLSEPSIFVQRSSENFLTILLTRDLITGNGSMINHILDILKTAEKCEKQRTFIGCINVLGCTLPAIPQDLLPGLGNTLGETVLKAFEMYPSEDQTADGLNKISVLFIDNKSCLSTVQHLSSCNRYVSAIKFSANYLLTGTCKEAELVQSLLGVVASPLYVLTGRQFLDGAFNQHLITGLSSLLTQRTTYYRILSNSLTQLARILVYTEKQFLQEIMMMSTEVLAARSKRDDSESIFLHPCNRSTSALLAFHKDLLNYGVTMNVEEAGCLLMAHVSLLQDISLPSATFQASCQVLSLLAPHLCRSVLSRTEHGICGWEGPAADSLGSCLNRRLLDRHWEVVDSIMELCTHLLISTSVCQGLSEWFVCHCLHVLLWDMLANQDAEGYVRAACIRTVVTVTCNDLCWKHLKEERALSMTLVEEQLCSLLTFDPEAFVQREAAKGILNLLESGFLSPESESVCQTLFQSVTSSLDWEVKVTAVQCWQKIVDAALRSCNEGDTDQLCDTYSNLFQHGCLNSLASALGDCDRPVRLLAAQVVRKMKRYVCKLKCDGFLSSLSKQQVPIHVTNIASDGVTTIAPEGLNIASDCVTNIASESVTSIASDSVSKVASEDEMDIASDCVTNIASGGVRIFASVGLTKVISEDKMDIASDGVRNIASNGVTSNVANNGTDTNVVKDEREKVLNMVLDIDMHERITAVIAPATNTITKMGKFPSTDFECWQGAAVFLWQCDLDSVIKESDSSTDVYQDNLSALLDDILAAVKGESDEEYQAIDCY